ncbi:MAG TPA: extracellular solute-binding protein [Candidatus Ornithospirochaeta avicola]|uniref:Extracellular solute-binding protein n=1 Tax=Candidatus Ornithospirochaeta avicola TaxID=2840896 RepID=A0A9D1PVB0_9SPIO|nr:extracellular solute-binding protein [Candidatus Ornithospirochaeta avicola]
MKRSVLLFMSSLLFISSLFPSGAKEDENTIEIWHSNTGAKAEAFENIVDNFNSTHENLKIKAVYQGSASDVLTKVKSAESAGGKTLPDIAILDATSALDMSRSRFLVTPEELEIDTSVLLDKALSEYSYKDVHIGLPFSASALLMYSNATLFEEASLAIPSTLDEMTAAGKVMKEKTGAYILSCVPSTYEMITFLSSQNGGCYITDNRNGHDGIPENVLFDDNGTFTFFLEKWIALSETGALNSITSGAEDEFLTGKTASVFLSSSNLENMINKINGRFDLSVSPAPLVNENATGGENIGGGYLAFFSQNYGVKEVAEYLISEDVQLYFAMNTGYVPVNKKVYDNPQWKSFLEENPLFSVAPEIISESSDKVMGLWIPSAYQIYHSFQKTIKDAVDKKINVKEAEDIMAKEIESALNEYRRIN